MVMGKIEYYIASQKWFTVQSNLKSVPYFIMYSVGMDKAISIIDQS